MFRCSVGVMAYNEEKNIGNLLDSLLASKTDNFIIDEIFVISGGSTDKTGEIVEKFSYGDRRVKLIRQTERLGKACSVNIFLKKAKGDICILSSADIAIGEFTVQNLCLPLLIDSSVGMTGSNPVPLNNPKEFLGYIVHFWWFLHNNLPRFGEMIAFRNVVREIDNTTAVDEAFIEWQIHKKGLHLRHVPSALVRNLGANSLRDLLRQRQRINIGHSYLKANYGYAVSSFDIQRIFELAVKYWRQYPSFKHIIWLGLGALLEIYCRISSQKDIYFLKKNPFIWDVAPTTKNEIKAFSYESV